MTVAVFSLICSLKFCLNICAYCTLLAIRWLIISAKDVMLFLPGLFD